MSDEKKEESGKILEIKISLDHAGFFSASTDLWSIFLFAFPYIDDQTQ